MYCKKCGRSLKGSAKFCPYCGEKVESNGNNDVKGTWAPEGYSGQGTAPGGYPVNTGFQKPNPVPARKPSKLPKGLVAALVFCVLAAVIGGGSFMYFGSRDKKEDSKPTRRNEEAVRTTEAVVKAADGEKVADGAKAAEEAPLESVEEAPASAKEPDFSAILAAYQQYADGFSDGDLRYSLIYINDDQVPECLIWFGSREIKILSYIGNAIKVFEPEYYGCHSLELAYTPQSGEFAVNQSYGVGGYDYTLAELSSGFEVKMHAESNGGFDYPGHWNAGYDIDGEPVDEETYYAQTDMSRFQQTLDTFSPDGMYDSILSAYAALTSKEQPAAQEGSEFILPESNLRYMTYHDLKGIDAENLRIAKNEIYARHGRMFQSEDLSQYFNSKSWYSGTVSPDSFSERVFNDFESGNISMIQYFQDGIPNGNYYAFGFQYKYFKIDSGILTVFAGWSDWGEGYALSLPISDQCVWWRELEQEPYIGGEDGILHLIEYERARYQESPSKFEDPIGISVEVKDGVVVGIKVYVS